MGEIRAGWLEIWSHLTNFVCFFIVVEDMTSVANFIVFDGFVCSEAGVVVICSGSTDICAGSWPEISFENVCWHILNHCLLGPILLPNCQRGRDQLPVGLDFIQRY